MRLDRDKRHILFELPTSRFSMRGIWLLLGLYLGSLLVAALVSPPLYQLAQAIESDWIDYLASKPFADYFDRLRLLSVVALFPFLFVFCGLNTRAKIGFKGDVGQTAGRWFLYGMGMIAFLYGSGWAFGVIAPKPGLDPSAVLETAAISLVGACLIGLIEETLFRGLVFRIFYTAIQPIAAIILSSLCFAFLHFKADGAFLAGAEPSEIGWSHGFENAFYTLVAIFQNFQGLALFNLVLAGILLHLAFLLANNLWACIGLHAGWIFPILTVSRTFESGPHANAFTGTERLLDGYGVSVAMAAVGICLAFPLLSRQRP